MVSSSDFLLGILLFVVMAVPFLVAVVQKIAHMSK